MFRDRAAPVAGAAIAEDVAAWFNAETDGKPQPPRSVTAILTTRDARFEARLLAPAIRACRERGDQVEIGVLPAHDETAVDDDALRRTLDVERIVLMPPPRPPAAAGPVQSEMRHAYRAYAFLKSRAPDLVLATQTLGAPYYAIRARELGIGLRRTRFAIVLAPFELQSRLNEHRVTSEAHALIRFHLERAVAAGGDVAVAPSRRFVENALRTGAAVEGSPFVVLPELEAPANPRRARPGRPASFIIPNVAPLARNVALFATVAKRRPDAVAGHGRPDSTHGRCSGRQRGARGPVQGAVRGHRRGVDHRRRQCRRRCPWFGPRRRLHAALRPLLRGLLRPGRRAGAGVERRAAGHRHRDRARGAVRGRGCRGPALSRRCRHGHRRGGGRMPADRPREPRGGSRGPVEPLLRRARTTGAGWRPGRRSAARHRLHPPLQSPRHGRAGGRLGASANLQSTGDPAVRRRQPRRGCSRGARSAGGRLRRPRPIGPTGQPLPGRGAQRGPRARPPATMSTSSTTTTS